MSISNIGAEACAGDRCRVSSSFCRGDGSGATVASARVCDRNSAVIPS